MGVCGSTGGGIINKQVELLELVKMSTSKRIDKVLLFVALPNELHIIEKPVCEGTRLMPLLAELSDTPVSI